MRSVSIIAPSTPQVTVSHFFYKPVAAVLTHFHTIVLFLYPMKTSWGVEMKHGHEMGYENPKKDQSSLIFNSFMTEAVII